MNKRNSSLKGLFWLVALIAIGAACVYYSPEIFRLAYNLAPYHPTNATAKNQKKLPIELACALRLPNQFLIGQVLMIGVHASDLQSEAGLFKQYYVGGAVIMDSPANPLDGSIKLFKNSSGSRGVPLLVATDEEGGYVQRFASLGILPSAEDAASTLTAGQAQALIAGHGQALKQAGIDIVFGPLADVAPKSGDSPLGNRIFSNDPAIVREYDLAYIRGWQSAGLLPTLKHFPGLGSATANTDFSDATTPPLSELKQRDFKPYMSGMAATGVAVMVGNQVVPGWSGGPASLSKTVNNYLRHTLGYTNNLIVTDSLTAKAITNNMAQANAATKAIAAGNDIVLFVLQDTSKGPNAALLSQLTRAITSALQSGKISRLQLAETASRKLAVQHISACTVAR